MPDPAPRAAAAAPLCQATITRLCRPFGNCLRSPLLRRDAHGRCKMDDPRVWNFEESLWRASEGRYHEQVDAECVMALSHAPYLFQGKAAVEAVTGTPEWDEVTF